MFTPPCVWGVRFSAVVGPVVCPKAVPAPIPSAQNAPSAASDICFRTMSVSLVMLLPLVIKALKEVVI